MYTEFAASHALAEKIIGSLLEHGKPGLVLSVDIGGSLFDIIATNAAETADCWFASTHSLLRHRADLGGVGRPMRVATVLAQSVIFGRADGWLRESNSREPVESYGQHEEQIATQTIDSWSVGRPPLRLIHLGDTELVMDQLHGGRETIAHDRPVLTFYTAKQDRAAFAALLQSHRYQAFNLSGAPVNFAEPAPSTDFAWIGVPEEWQEEVIAVTAAQAVRTRGRPPSLWEREADRSALPRQRRSAALFDLAPASSRPLPRERLIPAVDILCLNGCYPLETAGLHSWRWLGPQPRTRFIVPCPLPGAYRIALRITGCKLEGGLADCRVLAEGREVRTDVSGSLPGDISFSANIEPDNYAGYMEVDIVSAGTIVPVAGDSRILRLCLQSIAVSPWQ